MIPFTWTNDSITLIIDGSPVSVAANSPQYHAVQSALFNQDWKAIPPLLVPGYALQHWLGDKFVVISDGTITYQGTAVPDDINRRIHTMAAANEDPSPLFRFYERLALNPSWRSRTQLFDFMTNTGIPIEPDGTLLAYKGVNYNLTDCHTGTVDNSPGVTQRMDRNLISDDFTVPCHEGYHVGAHGYANSFGSRVVAVRVDPANVVCVPKDHSYMKMRVCEYTVIGLVGDGDRISGSGDDRDSVLMPSTTYRPDVDASAPDDDDEWGGDVEEGADEAELDEELTKALTDNGFGLVPDDDDDDDTAQAGRLPPAPIVIKVAKPPGPKAAAFARMTPGKLMEQSIDDLRKYASSHLKIVGAYKIPGGKSALVSAVLKARKRKAKVTRRR